MSLPLYSQALYMLLEESRANLVEIKQRDAPYSLVKSLFVEHLRE